MICFMCCSYFPKIYPKTWIRILVSIPIIIWLLVQWRPTRDYLYSIWDHLSRNFRSGRWWQWLCARLSYFTNWLCRESVQLCWRSSHWRSHASLYIFVVGFNRGTSHICGCATLSDPYKVTTINKVQFCLSFALAWAFLQNDEYCYWYPHGINLSNLYSIAVNWQYVICTFYLHLT